MSEKDGVEISEIDTTWMLVSATLVMFMIPGIGFFYSGLVNRKNALSLIMLSMLSLATVSLQWWLFGYSLTFSPTGGKFIGNFKNAVFNEVGREPSHVAKTLPTAAFAIFQGMFAAFTPAIIVGSGAERGRILPVLVFVFIWTTLVYDPIASWNWAPNGWSKQMGGLDFAGGTPVHIASGAAALAYCLILDRSVDRRTEMVEQHSVATTALGTVMLWFGWFGFNGGSTDKVSTRTAIVWAVTNLSASAGGITWMMLDYLESISRPPPYNDQKLSVVSFCSGVIAGLVCITPGAGYVGPAASVLFGFAGGVCCKYAVRLKILLNFDDALDVFAIHGIGGLVGNILTGIFAQSKWVEIGDDPSIDGGAIDGHPIQIAYQLADSAAGMAYSFVVTLVILLLMNMIPGLSLGAKYPEGIDKAEIGETAYHPLDHETTRSTSMTDTA